MKYILNETPVKTTNGFRINNITVDLDIPVVNKTNIFNINTKEMNKIDINIDKNNELLESKIGLSVNKDYNLVININDNEELKDNLEIEYHFNDDAIKLVSEIIINAGENTKGMVTIKLISDTDSYNFNYLKQVTNVRDNSKLTVNILPLLNKESTSLIAIENTIGENSKVIHNYYDLTGKTRLTNYYTELKDDTSKNTLNNIYIGNNEDVIDMNYLTKLKGIKTVSDMNTVGVINGKTVKSYKATIDFIEGAKKADGKESEKCTILSKTATTKSMPMMLCHEEDVNGSHSVSSGEIDEKQLFYLMSRGLSKKDALKVIVLASFNKLLLEQDDEELRNNIKDFLKGNNQKYIKEIKDKMLEASNNENYELAKEYKSILDSINHINVSLSVEGNDKTDRDIFAYSSREGYLSIAFLIYRNGLLIGKESHVVEAFGEEEEQVSELIQQLYSRIATPQEIVINNDRIINELSSYLDASIISVTKGKIYDLVLSAKSNADNALDEYFLSSKLDTDKIVLLEELGNLLNISTPYHIELFDNSHLQGSSPVGAMVVYINGEPNKSLYRKFKIEHEESRDDFASMREVITRHYLRNKNENKKMPDLILVDGGLPQVKSVTSALKDIELDIPVYGLYKNDKHSTSGIIDINEKIYPIEDKKLFFLLTRMQDEVHRFAISFHKQKRNKAMTVSLFDDIKGLGSKRKEVLAKAYPDINVLKQASIEELSQLLPKEVAEELYNKLH